jgi:hypothetical protein
VTLADSTDVSKSVLFPGICGAHADFNFHEGLQGSGNAQVANAATWRRTVLHKNEWHDR